VVTPTGIGGRAARLSVQHELAAWRAGIGGALDLGSVEGIQLPAALALLLRTDLVGTRERPFKQPIEALTPNS